VTETLRAVWGALFDYQLLYTVVWQTSLLQSVTGDRSQHFFICVVKLLGILIPMKSLAAGPAAQSNKESGLEWGKGTVAVLAAQ
jgi:hypothetical protein